MASGAAGGGRVRQSVRKENMPSPALKAGLGGIGVGRGRTMSEVKCAYQVLLTGQSCHAWKFSVA